MKTLPKGPFLGINNRLPDFDLHVGGQKPGDFLSAADNVDIDNGGNILRRKAAELIQPMTGAHSLFNGLMVRASVLYGVTLPTYSEALLKMLGSDAAMSYVAFNGDTYFSNGLDSGRVRAGAVYPIGLPLPSEPVVTTIAGDLFAGFYQVAVSYFNDVTGEEGGVGPSENYELGAVGGLRINLPAATPGATHVNVYVSTVNGGIPFLQTSVVAGTASVDITTLVIGREAVQRYEAPLPAGTLFMHNGALCSFDGSNIYRGTPYRPGYHIPSESRIPFTDEVTNAVSAQNGLYVTTTKMTYWLLGEDLADAQKVVDVLPYGGVKGTAFTSPDKTIYGWFGAKGVVIATPAGEVEAVMADNIDLTPPASGVSAIFETRGYRRVVSCGWCLNLANGAATQYLDYDFTSIDGEFGTKPDGIYALDSEGLLRYRVGFGSEDFGSENMKHVPAIYLGIDSSEKAQVRIVGGKHDFTYTARSSDTDMKIQRVDPGKGLRANWFDLSLVSEAGSDFTLASISFAPLTSNRKI